MRGSVRLSRLDKQETKIVLDPRASQGALENGGLHGVERGEEGAAVDIVLKLLLGLYFCRSVIARIQERQADEQAAGEPNQTGAHPQIILRPAEYIAANEFASERMLDSGKNQHDDERGATVGHEVTSQGAKPARGLRKKRANGFVAHRANE